MKLHALTLSATLALSLAALAAACTTEPGTGPLDAGDAADAGQDAGADTHGGDPGATDPGPADPGTPDADPGDPGLTDPGPLVDVDAAGTDADLDGAGDAVTDGAGGDLGDAGDVTGTDVGVDTAPDVATGPVCDPACADGEFCAADATCLPTCGGSFDGAALVAALEPGWTPTANLCGGGVGAWAFQPLSSAAVLELRAMDGDPLSTLNVDRVTFDTGAPTLQLISATTIPGSTEAFGAFPSLFLELDPTASSLVYGFTGPFDVASLTAPGAVFVGSLADPGSTPLYTVDAPSNFSVAALAPDSWLVSSAGAANTNDGTGLYLLQAAAGVVTATQVATNLGFANGYVARRADVVLVAGFADPWPDLCDGAAVTPPPGGNRAFVVSLAALQQAALDGTPIDAYCQAPSLDLGSEFHFLADGRVLSTRLDPATFEVAAIDVLTLSFDAGAGTAAITATTPLAVGAALSAAKGVPGASAIMLRHEAGYLLVEPSGQ